jgi:hypothetical protein
MKRHLSILTLAVLFAIVALGQSEGQKEGKGGTERERVKESGDVLKQILDMPDKGVPKSVLDGSKCVIVLPSVKKAAFGVGASYGRGVMTCRTGADYKGPWSAPIMMASSGGSFGFQIGGEATDFLIIVMNDGGAKSLLKSKVKMGADPASPPARSDAPLRHRPMEGCRPKCSPIHVRKGCSAAYRCKARHCDPMVTPMRTSMVKRLHRKKLSAEKLPCRRKPSS